MHSSIGTCRDEKHFDRHVHAHPFVDVHMHSIPQERGIQFDKRVFAARGKRDVPSRAPPSLFNREAKLLTRTPSGSDAPGQSRLVLTVYKHDYVTLEVGHAPRINV